MSFTPPFFYFFIIIPLSHFYEDIVLAMKACQNEKVKTGAGCIVTTWKWVYLQSENVHLQDMYMYHAIAW